MMKHTLLYIAAAVAAVAGFTSCDDDFAQPPIIGKDFVEPELVPATTTLAEFKAEYAGALTSATTIGLDANGDSIRFDGVVCSSDKSGNIFKNVVIQATDPNGVQTALTFAVNAYDLYENFYYGQPVSVNMTGLEVGAYSGLMQVGSISGTSMTFMDESTFTSHVRCTAPFSSARNVTITPATIPELAAAKTATDTRLEWMSRLVKLDSVRFENAGQVCCGAANTNRYIRDKEGNRLIVRMSAYADFKDEILPFGYGCVTGILSYFGSDWQILLNDFTDLTDFSGEGKPEEGTEVQPEGEGTLAEPYNVTKAVAIVNDGAATDAQVYVKGVVTAIDEIDTGSYGNATYTIADEGGTAGLIIYRGYGLNNKKFTSASELEVGAEVVVLGKLISFSGTPEMEKGNYIVSYNGEGGGSAPSGIDTSATYSCAKATKIESGAAYAMVVGKQYGAPIGETYNYGRLNLTDATFSGDTFDTAGKNIIFFTEVEGQGYTMTDAYGRYLAMDDSHFTSFQLYTTVNSGCYWTASFATDGTVKLTNTLNKTCFVCVSQGNEGTYYTNIAPADAPSAFLLPTLYKATKK